MVESKISHSEKKIKGFYLSNPNDFINKLIESNKFELQQVYHLSDVTISTDNSFIIINTDDIQQQIEIKNLIGKEYKSVILGYNEKNETVENHLFSDFLDFNADTSSIYSRINFLIQYKTGKTIEYLVQSKYVKYKIPVPKRLFDIFFSFFALLFLSPLLLIVMAAIRIESKGPIFYNGKRVGAGYRIFPFHKFRSMYVGADSRIKDMKHLNQYASNFEEDLKKLENEECQECKKLQHPCSPILYIDGKELCENKHKKIKHLKSKGTFVKIQNDPRVTKVGKFVRKTSIDELPQLFNVLKGDMSIVGNRPIPLYEAEMLTNDTWTERFLAPAGITGLWQVTKRGKSEMSEEERKQLDNDYARHYSFWYDMKLLYKTINALRQTEDV